MTNIVTLTVNDLNYQGWKSARIDVGLERIARSFELSITDLWPGHVTEITRVKPGDLVEIRIDNDLVCTGYIDATPIDYDANGITIMMRGRSKTADLVDSSVDISTGQFKNLNAQAVAQKLAAPYGLSVLTQVAVGNPVTDFQIQQGESAFESLDRIAKCRQKSGTDDAYGSAAAQMTGTAVDSQVVRKRVLIIRQSGQADNQTCQDRANYEQQVRRAKAGECRYRVQGWRQSNGDLWACNSTVQITDGIMGINTNLLISEVTYTLDDSGLITELVVIPLAAYATEPEVKAKAKNRKKSDKGVDTSWVD